MNEFPKELYGVMGTIIGAVIAGAMSHINNKSIQEWRLAKENISVLTEQLLAYHKLEELYAEKIAGIDINLGASVTVKKKMRDMVESYAEYKRPVITPSRIKSIRNKWVGI